MDELERSLRPVCVQPRIYCGSPAFAFLWSHTRRPAAMKQKCLSAFKKTKQSKKKDLIKRSARPSGLSKCVLHPRGNTGTSHIEYSRSIWQTSGTRMQICSLLQSIPTELTHIQVWQWFNVLPEASERTSSSKEKKSDLYVIFIVYQFGFIHLCKLFFFFFF